MSKATKNAANNAKNYALSDEKVTELKAAYAKDKSFPMAYRGNYGAIIAALKNLGVNKFHSFASFKARVASEMGREAWGEFSKRESRNENGLDCDGRLHQNVLTLRRVGDYGLKLLQTGTKILKSKGCVIDLAQTKDGWTYSLNTNSNTPSTVKLAKAVETPKAVKAPKAKATKKVAVKAK